MKEFKILPRNKVSVVVEKDDSNGSGYYGYKKRRKAILDLASHFETQRGAQ